MDLAMFEENEWRLYDVITGVIALKSGFTIDKVIASNQMQAG